LIGQSLDVQFRRERLGGARQHVADAIDDVDGRGRPCLQHGQENAASPVLADDIGQRVCCRPIVAALWALL